MKANQFLCESSEADTISKSSKPQYVLIPPPIIANFTKNPAGIIVQPHKIQFAYMIAIDKQFVIFYTFTVEIIKVQFMLSFFSVVFSYYLLICIGGYLVSADVLIVNKNLTIDKTENL